jgi:O-methyltransferase
VSSIGPAQLVTELARAHIAARCLHVVAAAGVADAIGERATTPAEISANTGLDADAVDRMLRLLAAHGVFKAERDGYSHNEASALMRSEHPQSLRNYVRMAGSRGFWDRFTELERAAKTGRPAADYRDLLARYERYPDEAAFFNAAMVSKSRRVIPAVVEAYDFAGCRIVADIGGGRGHLLDAILAQATGATGVLFDLPQVVADAGLRDTGRRRVVSGDFFKDPLPSADAYLLMDLLHDWADADAARILAAVRRAAHPRSRVLIVETLVPEGPGPHFGKTLDIIMLAVTGGRERTEQQYAALLSGAGLRLARVLPTTSEYSIVEAVVA